MGHEIIYFSIEDEKNLKTDNKEYFVKKKVNIDSNFANKTRNFYSYFYNIEAKKKLEYLLEAEKPDLAHIHLIFGGLTPSILVALKRKKIPIVHTVHDYRMICPAYTFLNAKGDICEQCKNRKYYNCVKNKCGKNNLSMSFVMAMEMYFRNIFFKPAKFFDGIMYVSNFSRKKHFSFDENLSKTTSTVLYNACKNDNKLCETSKRDYYLYFGRLSYEKGLLTLIKSFKRHKDKKLIVVGLGPLYNDIKELINIENLKNIKLLGYKTGVELSDIIANSKYVIIPSEWYENNPMTIIEAYSNGVPVIGANIGGIPEILKNNVTGFLFPPRNDEELSNTIEISANITENEYNELCINSKSFFNKNFSADQHYNLLIDFYKKVIEKHKVN